MKKRIILKRGQEKRILAGHPWVYDNEVKEILGTSGLAVLEPGETADVESVSKTYLGRALVNPQSKIIARIYSPSKEGIDKGFFKRRIREALERRNYDFSRESCRIVFAEADFLPGLIIDRFVGWSLDDVENATLDKPLSFPTVEKILGAPHSWTSIQFLTFGMDIRREEILAALNETLIKPQGIIEKSAAKVRELEGLPLKEGVISGSFPDNGIVIFEKAQAFAIHIKEGQKTGHFLDQSENRALSASLIRPGGSALDAFCYTGGFAIHLARSGATQVIAVDTSTEALNTLKTNARLNAVENAITPTQGDAFEVLRSMEHAKEKFDMVVLDPPAFAKTHTVLKDAIRGYKEINLRALRLLKAGGVLVTCSCSQALDEYRFRRIVADAALDAERRIHQIAFRHQSPDHPILLGYDESLYLKAGFYRAV
ncbi:MAG: class I SAM-dependent rRNA methyltransferase [Treponema sp.]|jgi:23S rRNA (cytosine1962-C5)-methyltransferase|nr:class I SAM-dependent rRNA methyltransferase [Treponema sp.]